MQHYDCSHITSDIEADILEDARLLYNALSSPPPSVSKSISSIDFSQISLFSPQELQEHMAQKTEILNLRLAEAGYGDDACYEIKSNIFEAHKCILAASHQWLDEMEEPYKVALGIDIPTTLLEHDVEARMQRERIAGPPSKNEGR